MTTLLLVTLGILLAAAAALMTVWYGGDAFNGADAKAHADQLMNVGGNVRSAANMYMVRHGRHPETPARLAERALSMNPGVDGIGRAESEWRNLGTTSDPRRAYVVTGIRDEVCRHVNRNIIGGTRGNAILSAPEGLSGCYDEGYGNVYYAMLTSRAIAPEAPGDEVPEPEVSNPM